MSGRAINSREYVSRPPANAGGARIAWDLQRLADPRPILSLYRCFLSWWVWVAERPDGKGGIDHTETDALVVAWHLDRPDEARKLALKAARAADALAGATVERVDAADLEPGAAVHVWAFPKGGDERTMLSCTLLRRFTGSAIHGSVHTPNYKVRMADGEERLVDGPLFRLDPQRVEAVPSRKNRSI